ncbi:unnamed protein product [Parnassius apollo]|uniref:(apollo) hypothetical protein n=1 Tax=Parnassius apollo TaxID=110799 RepID=A0A8S3XWZ2_PARAO|nr:unnamed protein product [Parnassius apollo]
MNTKVTGNKYKVHEMKQCDFYNTKSLISGKQNWLKDTKGNKIKWAKIMKVKVSRFKPHILQFKYNFEEEYLELGTEILLTRPRRGRKATASIAAEAESIDLHLKQAYDQQILISKALHVDLLSLCTSNAIPQQYHAFYDSLTSCEGNPSEHSDSELSEHLDDKEYTYPA